jgi:septum formation protein
MTSPTALPALVLGSTSRYRRALLERLGVPFSAVAPACDEEALKLPGLTPQALAESLADAKAESLVPAHPAAVIIGSDQICALDAEVLHKPGTPERAIAQLARMRGRPHRLITAMTVIHGPHRWRHTDITTLTMRSDLDDAALARYVAADHPVDCSGAYKLEQRGVTLFSHIDSADQTAIVGLPLIALTAILTEIGFHVP